MKNETSQVQKGSSNKAKQVEISLWKPQSPVSEEIYYKKKIDEFNKMYQDRTKINLQVVTRGNSFAYEDRLYTAAASNTLPDIVFIDGPNIANYAFSRIIIPLDQYYSKDEMDDFLPSIIQQGTFNGKLYAVGQAESSAILFYNKKIMQENGIEPPTDMDKAWTWDDWYNVMKKCSKNGIMGTNLINDKGEWMTYCFEQFWISNGTDLLNKEGTRAEGFVNGAKGFEAAEFISKLAKEKLFNIDPMPSEFEEGKAATMLGGVWNIPYFKNNQTLQWGLTYFPKKSGGIQSAPSGGWALAVSSQSKNPDEAVTVLKFLTDKDASAEFARVSGDPTNRKSAFEKLTEYQDMPLKVIKDQVTHVSHPRPVTPFYPVLTHNFAIAMFDIMMGSDVKKSLDEVAKSFDREYKRNFPDN
jgi:fructooligosaccharide transport system substrate-binding protein